MEFLRADSHLRAQSELRAVGEPRAGIVVHRRRVHLAEEPAGGVGVVRHDGFGMAGTVVLDVRQRVVQAVHHLNRRDQRQKFLPEILRVGRYDVQPVSRPQDAQRPVVAAHLHSGAVQLGRDLRQAPRRRLGVHQHRVQRVAHGGPLHLGVEHDARRHLGIGVPVNISVAHPHAAGHHRHGGVFRHEVDQPGTTPGHQQVDVLFHSQHHVHQRPVGVGYELHGVGGQAGLADGAVNQRHQRGVGPQRLLAAPQDAGVARFQRQRNDVGGDVGPALVDAGEHAQRHPPLFNLQPVFQGEGLHQLAHRVRQRGHSADVRCHPVQPLRRQQQPVEKGVVDSGVFRVPVVRLVCLQHRPLLGFQRLGDVLQRVVSCIRRLLRQRR